MTGKAHKKEFYGKYRGTVVSNLDPDFKGRITAMVPDVLGLVPTTWATPCVPMTGLPGLQSGLYVVPEIGASVWMEFEHGDPDYPIWTGCFWSGFDGRPRHPQHRSADGRPEYHPDERRSGHRHHSVLRPAFADDAEHHDLASRHHHQRWQGRNDQRR